MITFAITYFIMLGLAVATAKGARSPVRLTEHGSAVLVWLEKHPRPGTPRTRRKVERRAQGRVWTGLRLAGVLPAFMCIHHYEGAWNDYGDPFWGGLQMDRTFMVSYGPEYVRVWGYAHNWPVWAQLVAGYRAWRTRGFGPWPTTRRICGV